MAGDPVSAFGSVLGLNRPVDAATAQLLTVPGLFVEAIIAPDFAAEALEILTTQPKWKANVRLMKVGELFPAAPHTAYRFLDGGMLVQEADVLADPEEDWTPLTAAQPTPGANGRPADRLGDRAARQVERHRPGQGRHVAGDRRRTDEPRRFRHIAVGKAGQRATGSVMASDAFFPFADSIEQAAAAGVAAVIQPGGSRNDDQCIAACDKHGLSMIFTGRRHFKH